MKHVQYAFAATLIAVLPAQDQVLDWNDVALAAIRTAGTAPPPASRNLAILHTAVFDAVNGLEARYEQYTQHPTAPRNASPQAAATVAGRDVLVALYPAQRATFEQRAAQMLAQIADGERKTRGIAWGQTVALDLLTLRATDGSTNTAPYPGSTEPGRWRPHISFGGQVRPALLPLWGSVQPFALRSGRQFRPPEQPALRSFQYAFEQWVTQYLGGRDNSLRNAEQTEIARFWGYGPGTSTPPGHWNQIAHEVAQTRNDSLVDRARQFALLNIALADAAIVSWDCKYVMGFWRPITAIQLADTDGNIFTQADRNWMPLLDTPPFPEYTSGHSTFSAAAAAVLAEVFGRDRIRFSVGSDDLPGVRRTYASFSEAAWESGISRVYGGIHYWSANVMGLSSGHQTGQYALQTKLQRR
jgi:membrane-associated phospholipid phosphatase